MSLNCKPQDVLSASCIAVSTTVDVQHGGLPVHDRTLSADMSSWGKSTV